MSGWKIFLHSARMVSNNLIEAFRISFLLYAVQVAVNIWFMGQYGEAIQVMQSGTMMSVPDGYWPSWGLTIAVSTLTSLWIAVGWHRFVLMQENPIAVLPQFHGNQIVAYLIQSLLLGLRVGVIAVIVMVFAGFALGAIFGNAGTMLGVLIVVTFSVYLFYRWGLVLPAAALGNSMFFKESWDSTVLASGAIWQLSAVALGASLLVMLPQVMSSDLTSLINQIYTYVLNWIIMMVGVSVLTTLYGIYVEGRDL